MSDEEPVSDMPPEEAAAYATGGPETAEGSAAGHMPAEGIEAPQGPTDDPFWYRAVRNTSPNPPIDEVGSLQDIRDNWESYGLRGLQKLGGVDDAEAWVDLTKFLVGAIIEIRTAGESGASAEAGEALPTGPQADKHDR